MGEAGQAGGLSDAAGGHAADRTAARFSLIGDFLGGEGGATAIEYGLIVALIFLLIVATFQLFANNVNTMYAKINTTVATAT